MARPKFEVTEDSRKIVERAKCAGFTDEDIAKLLDISADTLTKYFSNELKKSKIKVVSAVSSKLINKAMSGDNACMFFYLKTQAGWRETSNLELSGEIKHIAVSVQQKEKKVAELELKNTVDTIEVDSD